MKPIKEKIQTKLNSMASIAFDNIMVPNSEEQSGQNTIKAGFFDKFGNKINLKLDVNIISASDIESGVAPDQSTDSIDLLESRVSALEETVSSMINTPDENPSQDAEQDPEQGLEGDDGS